MIPSFKLHLIHQHFTFCCLSLFNMISFQNFFSCIIDNLEPISDTPKQHFEILRFLPFSASSNYPFLQISAQSVNWKSENNMMNEWVSEWVSESVSLKTGFLGVPYLSSNYSKNVVLRPNKPLYAWQLECERRTKNLNSCQSYSLSKSPLLQFSMLRVKHSVAVQQFWTAPRFFFNLAACTAVHVDPLCKTT